MIKLQERLREPIKLINDPPWYVRYLNGTQEGLLIREREEAADALDAAEAEIARLKSALLTGIGCNLNELANKGLPFEWSSMSGIGVMCRALGFSVNELTPELKAALAAEKFNPDNLARLHALKTAQPPAVGEDVVERAAIAFFDAMQKQMPESEKIKSWDDDAGDPDAEWARNAIRAGAKAALEATMLRTKDAG